MFWNGLIFCFWSLLIWFGSGYSKIRVEIVMLLSEFFWLISLNINEVGKLYWFLIVFSLSICIVEFCIINNKDFDEYMY